LLILTQSFITSEVGFDDYLHRKYNYSPVGTEMEKDTQVLPNTDYSSDKKSNGGKKKKRKTRRFRKKRLTQRKR
jgi:hypothetical protein